MGLKKCGSQHFFSSNKIWVLQIWGLKQNTTKYRGHFVPQQHPRIVHTICLDQDISIIHYNLFKTIRDASTDTTNIQMFQHFEGKRGIFFLMCVFLGVKPLYKSLWSVSQSVLKKFETCSIKHYMSLDVIRWHQMTTDDVR